MTSSRDFMYWIYWISFITASLSNIIFNQMSILSEPVFSELDHSFSTTELRVYTFIFAYLKKLLQSTFFGSNDCIYVSLTSVSVAVSFFHLSRNKPPVLERCYTYTSIWYTKYSSEIFYVNLYLPVCWGKWQGKCSRFNTLNTHIRYMKCLKLSAEVCTDLMQHWFDISYHVPFFIRWSPFTIKKYSTSYLSSLVFLTTYSTVR